MTKKIFYSFAALIIVLLLVVGIAPSVVDKKMNGVLDLPFPELTSETQNLHDSLRIMDWHADSLMWKRDILQRTDHSHVDLPKLQQGNVAIQMFTVVSKSPYGMNNVETPETFDMITPLIIAQGWPARTWNSLLERALYQAEKLQRAVDASDGQLMWLRNQTDLQALLAARNSTKPTDTPPIGALFGIEGAHPLEGKLENIDVLYDAGLRMAGLQHFFDNLLGGSLHGVEKGGLTEFGKQVVVELNRKQIIIDVAHSSQKVVEDVLEISNRPIVVSHTGIYGACHSPRNLPDELMKRIAEKGGLVALGYWDAAICDVSPKGIAQAIKYAVKLLGENHVVLGSDFDGTVTTPFDTSELSQLTQALIEVGLSETQIRKVMGENSLRFLQNQLPK